MMILFKETVNEADLWFLDILFEPKFYFIIKYVKTDMQDKLAESKQKKSELRLEEWFSEERALI